MTCPPARCTRRLATSAIAGLLLAAPWVHAQQAAYPGKTIRIVVPFVAGDATDSVGRLVHKGTAPALNDLLGGHVSFMFENPLSAAGHIKSGKLRALAVTSGTRNAAYPDLPAMAEIVPGFEVRSWFGLMGPAGIPADIQARLHAAMVQIFTMPDVQERLAGIGGEAQPMGPAEFTSYAAREVERWGRVVKASSAKVD